jgi:hypothetical protein
MKKLLLLFLAVFAITYTYAQGVPQIVCYQGVAADAKGTELSKQKIALRFSIIKGQSPTGAPIYAETHATSTDEFGLFKADIGGGSIVSGKFSDIKWGDDTYWLRVEMDPSGGGAYQLLGTTQLVSVPYALYAGSAKTAETAKLADSVKVAGKALTAIDDKDRDPTNEIQKFFFDAAKGELKLVPATDPQGSDTVKFQDADSDPTNELQKFAFNPITGMLKTNKGGNTPFTDSLSIRGLAFTAPGASLSFPLGVIGEAIVNVDAKYTVPPGKMLFVSGGPEKFTLTSATSGDIEHLRYPDMPVFESNTIIKNSRFTGILVNNSQFGVEAKTIDLQALAVYQVPQGKTFVLKSGLLSDGYIIINDKNFSAFDNPGMAGTIVLPSGTTVKKLQLPGTDEKVILTGYLYPNM